MRQAKRDAINWAKSVVADPSAVFLDTETSGLGDDAEICDIAIVSVDGTVLFDALVRPNNPIPEAVTAVHGITNEMVLSWGRWDVVANRVFRLLYGRKVVVYNAKYDFPLVSRLWSEDEQTRLEPLWTCAMHLYGAFDGTEAGWRGGYKWHKLSAACEHFGIEPGNHRALADAEACRQLVIAMSEVEE